MTAEVVSTIRRTLSEPVEDPLDFLQRTAQLYYRNDGNMKEIHKQLSAPGGSLDVCDSASSRNCPSMKGIEYTLLAKLIMFGQTTTSSQFF